MIALKATQTSFIPKHIRWFITEGDSRKQELLARIAMLQAQKVRLTDYLDERSAYLSSNSIC